VASQKRAKTALQPGAGAENENSLATVVCSALICFLAVLSPALAQPKTAKECRTEWQANKADNQAKGVTAKAYVAQCRSGGV
jgi:hypothetical protein